MAPQRPWHRHLRKQACVYCQSVTGGHLDHVPPRSLFVHSRQDLIRVPACSRCNTGRSELDEKFRLLTGLWTSSTTPELLFESARGLTNRPSWREELRKNSFWRPWSNDFEVRLPTGVFEPIITQMTRALYWYEYGDRLDAALP